MSMNLFNSTGNLEFEAASEFSNNNNNFGTSDSHTHMDSRILSSGDEDDEEDDRMSKIGFQQKGEDAPDSPEKENLIGSDVLSSMHCFYRKQGKGFIDVWWLFDDGGWFLFFDIHSKIEVIKN